METQDNKNRVKNGELTEKLLDSKTDFESQNLHNNKKIGDAKNIYDNLVDLDT